jgi:hypothetical protein
MADLYVNNSSVWTSVKQPYVHTSGSFTPAKAVYVNKDGTWVQVFFRFAATITSAFPYVRNTYTLRDAAIAAGWSGTSKLNATITIPDYMTILGTGNNTSAAINLAGLTTNSFVTINNNGIIVGSGGAAGYKTSNSNAVSYPGNYVGSFVTPTFANGYTGTGYPVGPGAGGSTPGYNYSSGGTTPGAGSGSAGGSAIYLASNISLIINNSGTLVGGGGGAGGQAGNNAGGGGGGNGGYLIEETGSHAAVIAVNSSNAGSILASGGGGSGGWGNRYENDGIGGLPGFPATNLYPGGNVGGNYGGNGISPGLATNNTGTTLINTSGTFTLSPAV